MVGLVKLLKFPFLCLMGIFLIGGCATPQKAIYLAPSFEQSNVDKITILPIVDARTQRPFEINHSELQKNIYPVIETDLIKKDYTVEYSNNVEAVQCLKFGRSTSLEPECLQKVGPKNSRWILVLFLQDFQMRTPYGGAVSAKMSGVLFDRSEGLLLWMDLEYAGLSRRELVGENRKTLITIDVLQMCGRKLMRSLPKKVSSPGG